MRALALLLTLATPAWAAGPQLALTPVKATCAIVGTAVSAAYTGSIQDILDRARKPRTVGVLTMTPEAVAKKAADSSATLTPDLVRYGAARMQPPQDVTIASTENRAGTMIGFGSGDTGNSPTERLAVQVECDLKRGR